MKKREIDIFEHMNEILGGVRKGVLLMTADGENTNGMMISWGTVGIEWGKPIFTTFVREHRHSKGLLDKTGEFVVSIPTAALDEKGKKIFKVCGSQSGRDINKVAETGMTLVPGDDVCVPGIKEWPLTLECRVIYKQLQDRDAVTPENRERFHPEGVDWHETGANEDYHVAYYGEIVRAYVIEDDE